MLSTTEGMMRGVMDGTVIRTRQRLNAYAPGDRGPHSGGLVYSNILNLLDFATVLTRSKANPSDQDRATRFREIEFRRSRLHYCFEDRDHSSKLARTAWSGESSFFPRLASRGSLRGAA